MALSRTVNEGTNWHSVGCCRLSANVTCVLSTVVAGATKPTSRMHYRALGRTGWEVSSVSFGAWAIGGSWGANNDDASIQALHRALDLGVNFIDTADVYGDGHSERLIAKVRAERSDPFYVATKVGRRASPHSADSYTAQNLADYVERSLKNLAVDTLDLVQLHCPPTDVYYRPEVFGALDDLVRAGKLRHYGVSVERVEEGLKALEYPGVQSIQIVYNLFRQRPAALLFRQAELKGVGILARLPLSSGMLTGKLRADTAFAADDHRSFNRQGEAFDRGETFSGLDYATGLRAVERLRPLVPNGVAMHQMALRWILTDLAVSCVIPGIRTPAQAEDNCRAADLAPLEPALMASLNEIYADLVKPHVHHLW